MLSEISPNLVLYTERSTPQLMLNMYDTHSTRCLFIHSWPGERESAAIICSSQGRTSISHGEVRRKFRADIKAVCFHIRFVHKFIYNIICMSSYHLVIFLFVFFPLLFLLLCKYWVRWSPFMHSQFSKLFFYIFLDILASSVLVWT
jgi:hypothetical protein